PPLFTKEFGPQFWKLPSKRLEVIADEVFYWDGTKTDHMQFYSTNKNSADFIQHALAASNRVSSLKFQDRPNRANSSRLYIIHTRRKSLPLGLRKPRNGEPVITREPNPDGFKYCFTTTTGFFIARRNGHVFITGNSGKTLLALKLMEHSWL